MPTIPVTLPLVLLIALLVGAVSLALYSWLATRQRRAILLRVEGGSNELVLASPLLTPDRETFADRIAKWVAEHAPAAGDNLSSTSKLLQAGFESRTAAVLYAAIRVGLGLMLPLLTFVLVAGRPLLDILQFVALSVAVAGLGPPAVLDRLVQIRRDKLRRAVPDALDLLVVCVEAGVSLDAAMLRVARDLAVTHPDLAGELLVVNRKVNAGITREEALHGLWLRTGLEELRGLAANMVQSERWGTSIAKVLRINAETLRRKRKQAAEKKAAQAALKMMGPLLLFLLPALFVVILGPAFLRIQGGFGGGQ